MIILIHVSIALASMILSTAHAFWPSRVKLYASMVLILATLASGTYLVISLHSSILHACVMGLAYLGVAASGLGVGAYRFAAEKAAASRQD